MAISWTRLTIVTLKGVPIPLPLDKKKKVERVTIRLETGNHADALADKVTTSTVRDPHIKMTIGDSEWLISVWDLEQAIKVAKSGTTFAQEESK